VRIIWAMTTFIHHAFIMFFNTLLCYSCVIYIHSIPSRLLVITDSLYSGMRAHTSRVLEVSNLEQCQLNETERLTMIITTITTF
jgi:hypothetical protein